MLKQAPNISYQNNKKQTAVDVASTECYSDIHNLLINHKFIKNYDLDLGSIKLDKFFQYFDLFDINLAVKGLKTKAILEVLKELKAYVNSLNKGNINNAELFDLYITFQSLKLILADSDEQDIKPKLQELFNQRDLLIRGTNLDFCFYQGVVNRNLLILVNTVWQDELHSSADLPNNEYDILMANSLKLKGIQGELVSYSCPILIEDLSIPDVPSSYVRDNQGYIHRLYNEIDEDYNLGIIPTAIKKISTAKKCSDLWLNEDPRLNTESQLADTLIAWLIDTHQELRIIHEYTYQFEKDAKNNNVLQQINALIDGLAAGGKKQGSGSEEYAGVEAVLATQKFSEWLMTYKHDYPDKYNKLMNLSVKISNGKSGLEKKLEDKTFEQIIYPVLYPREALEKNKHASCSDTNGSNLKVFCDVPEIVGEISLFNSNTNQPIVKKTPAEIEVLKNSAVSSMLNPRAYCLSNISNHLPSPYKVSHHTLEYLALLAQDNKIVNYNQIALYLKTLEQPGMVDVKSIFWEPTSIQNLSSSQLRAGFIGLEFINDMDAFKNYTPATLEFKSLKSYIAVKHQLGSNIENELLELSLQQAIDLPISQEAWISHLLDLGLSPQSLVSFKDLNFRNLKVGEQVLIKDRQIDYQIVAINGRYIRLRPPQDLAPIATGRYDYEGSQIYSYPTTYKTDGKDDIELDLIYNWSSLQLGTTNARSSFLTPVQHHNVELINYALINLNFNLLEKLILKSTSINISMSMLFNKNHQVHSKELMFDLVKLLFKCESHTSINFDAQVLNALLTEAIRLNEPSLIVKLVALGLNPLSKITIKDSSYFNHYNNYNYNQTNTISIIDYAFKYDYRDLITACVAKGAKTSNTGWYADNIPKGASIAYLKALKDNNNLKIIDYYSLHQCFKENQLLLTSFTNRYGTLPQDSSKLNLALTLAITLFNLLSSTFKEAELNSIFINLTSLFEKVELNEHFKGIFSTIIINYLIEILIINSKININIDSLSSNLRNKLLLKFIDNYQNTGDSELINSNICALICKVVSEKEMDFLEQLKKSEFRAFSILVNITKHTDRDPQVIKVLVETLLPDITDINELVLLAHQEQNKAILKALFEHNHELKKITLSNGNDLLQDSLSCGTVDLVDFYINSGFANNLANEQLPIILIDSLKLNSSNSFEILFSKYKSNLDDLTEETVNNLFITALANNKMNYVKILFNNNLRLNKFDANTLLNISNSLIEQYLELLINKKEQLPPKICAVLAQKAQKNHATESIVKLISCGLSPDLTLLEYAFNSNSPKLLQTVITTLNDTHKDELCTAFKDVYDALYNTRTILNGSFYPSFFRTPNRWLNKEMTLDDIINYCKAKPHSRSAQSLQIVMKHIDVFINNQSSTKSESKIELFKELHKLSMNSSIFSRTHITNDTTQTIESIIDYAQENKDSRTNVIATAIGISSRN